MMTKINGPWLGNKAIVNVSWQRLNLAIRIINKNIYKIIKIEEN
jgi:hypothetical protein